MAQLPGLPGGIPAFGKVQLPVTKSDAGYRNTAVVYPCRTCVFFQVPDADRKTVTTPGTCKVVQGEDIMPGGTCVMWRHYKMPFVKERPMPPLWFRPSGVIPFVYSKVPAPDMRAKG